MISLFIDTADKNVIVSILNDLEIIYYDSVENKNDLSEKLLPMVEKAFDSVSLNIKNVEKIFAVNGPGSFTGVRIGVTVAKTIAWSIKCPIILLSELELLATTKTTKKNLVPIIDARRGYVYAGIYDKNLKCLLKDRYVSYENLLNEIDDANEVEFIGYDKFDNTVIPNIDIIKIIKKHFKSKGINPHSANPNYLKKTEAEENLVKND